MINKLVKRRRAFVILNIEPYDKKQKITSHVIISLDNNRRNFVPYFLSSAKFKDTLWMLECFFFPKKTPMWVRWNSLKTPDKNDAQENVYYLLQINLPLT